MIMTIGNVNGVQGDANTGFGGANMQTDAVSRSIMKQIERARERLQEMSSDENMTPEDKMKKRQEIQQEIAELNRQLRQHQIEMKKEQQTESNAVDELLGDSGRHAAGNADAGGLSQASVEVMISAEGYLKQAQIQGSVASGLEGKARVLKAEIKQDAGKGTELKEAELAKTEQKAMNANASRMNTLADINRTIEEAREEDMEKVREKIREEVPEKIREKDEDGEKDEGKDAGQEN